MKTSIRFLVVLSAIVMVAIFTIANFSTVNYINRPHGISSKPTEMKHTSKLYFVNDDKMLEHETRTITVKNNDFVGAVLQELIAGPRDEHLYTCIDENVKILSSSLVDKKCVIDFSPDITYSSFFKYGYFDQMIWSIVNSLTALDNIDKVQILIDGEEIQSFKPDFMFYGNLTRNERIVYIRPKPPADVVLNFLELITTERYDLAYDLIAFKSREKVSFPNFVTRMMAYNKSNIGFQRSIYFTQSYSSSLVIFIKYLSNDIDEYGNRTSKNEQWEMNEEDGKYKILIQ